MNLKLIHIGKCGGSNLINKLEQYHRYNIDIIHIYHKQKNLIKIYNDNNNEFILLLRDPITKFTSNYYYWYRFYKRLKKTGKVFKSKDNHYYTVKSYVKYFDKFDSPNKLAESLSNENLKYLANKFMRHMQHNLKGLNYYLVNEKVVKSLKSKIKYVIKKENYNEDFMIFYENFCKNLNLEQKDLQLSVIINNTSEYKDKKFLSEKAIKNLKKFFSKDYKMFNILLKHNIIDKKYYNSFL